jgi:hypothetical protein
VRLQAQLDMIGMSAIPIRNARCLEGDFKVKITSSSVPKPQKENVMFPDVALNESCFWNHFPRCSMTGPGLEFQIGISNAIKVVFEELHVPQTRPNRIMALAMLFFNV